ncbi:MAG: hypothetical protein KIT24_09875 [Phycisphaeraceae bacterium]|nr:hypothetical protein [Phycisphaeraceae bacterium]
MPGRFLIQGADRETGRPTSLVLEAASQSDAEGEALRRGVLIADVKTLPGGEVDVRGSARAETVESRENHESGESLAIPIPYAGRIELLDGEKEIGRYEAGRAELGLRATVLRRRSGLILTNRRLISYEKRLLGAPRLQTLMLNKLDGVRIGSRLNPWLALVGVAGLLVTSHMAISQLATTRWGIANSLKEVGSLLGSAGVGAPAAEGGGSAMIRDLLAGTQGIVTAIVLVQVVACVWCLHAAFTRELVASAGLTRCGLTARWLGIGRAKAFLELVQRTANAARGSRREYAQEIGHG